MDGSRGILVMVTRIWYWYSRIGQDQRWVVWIWVGGENGRERASGALVASAVRACLSLLFTKQGALCVAVAENFRTESKVPGFKVHFDVVGNSVGYFGIFNTYSGIAQIPGTITGEVIVVGEVRGDCCRRRRQAVLWSATTERRIRPLLVSFSLLLWGRWLGRKTE